MAIKKEKCGYLDVKLPTRLKGFGWTSWRRRWVLLHHLTDLADNKTIIRMTFCSSQEVPNQPTCLLRQRSQRERDHTLYIEDIKSTTRIRSKTKAFAFTVMVGSPQESSIYLAGNSETDAQEWMEVFRMISSGPDNERELDIGEVHHETCFIDNESSLRLGLSGHYLMVVSMNALAIYSCQDGSLCHEWRLNHLLCFYVEDNTATVDKNKILVVNAGRSSPTGAGVFSFFFHNADANEVISTIVSSIQRATMRRDSEANYNDRMSINYFNNNEKEIQGCATRIKRAGSCGLPSDRPSGSFSGEVEHRRQSSLPYDIERAICVNSLNNPPLNREAGRQSRRSTIISRTSVKSEENKGKNLLKSDGKKNCAREIGTMQKHDVNSMNNSGSDSSKQIDPSLGYKSQDKPFENGNGKAGVNSKSKNNGKNLHGITESDAELVIPNYFRRPSWFSDTTSPGVESSSSEEYKEKTIKHCPKKKSFNRKRAQRSENSDIVSSAEKLFVEPGPSQSEYSDNEADDEVDNDDDTDDNTITAMSRKTSAGSHLYQELPETSNPTEHTHCTNCKLCYKPPLTPPELPPRSELMSPRHRFNSDSVCSQHVKNLQEETSRKRAISDTPKAQNGTEECQQLKIPSVQIFHNGDQSKSKLSNLKAQTVQDPHGNHGGRNAEADVEFPRKAMGQSVNGKALIKNVPSMTSIHSHNMEDDMNRKISGLSGFYNDIEDGTSDDVEGNEKGTVQPPELPPRCEAHCQKQTDEEHYEDLDRYRKNLQKYYGIPFSELDPPPPLPSRPKSLPSPNILRNRVRSRLRSVVRKKRGQKCSSEILDVSKESPIDEGTSVKDSEGVRRVPAWPLLQVNQDPKRHSLTTENSIYSSQDEIKVGNDYFTQGHSAYRYVSFHCATCGAANELYSSPPQTFRPRSFPPTSVNHHMNNDMQSIPIPFHQLTPPSPPWYHEKPVYRESVQTESAHQWSDSLPSDIISTYGESDTASQKLYVNNFRGEYLPKTDDLPEADNDIYTDMSGANGNIYLSMDSLGIGEQKKIETPMCTAASVTTPPKEPIYVNWPPRTYKEFK